VEEGVRAAWPSCGHAAWIMQQGQPVLPHGSWRMATWGRHMQAS